MGCQAFMRPIEITSANDDLTITVGGVGPTPVVVPAGVWSSQLTLIEWLRRYLVTNFGANCVVGFTSNNRLAIANQGAGNITIAWTDTALGYLFGFQTNLAPALVHYADDVPEYAWFPAYQSTNQERFAIRQSDASSGSASKDGTLAGTSTGPDVYERPFNFEHIDAPDVFRSAALLRDTGLTAGKEWDADRCFETLIKNSRTAVSATAGYPSSKGFYYVPDMRLYRFATDSPLTDGQPTFPSSQDSGGVCFDATTDPDDWCFGYPDDAGANTPKASVPRARQYYECVFDFHTAPAPTFYVPTWP